MQIQVGAGACICPEAQMVRGRVGPEHSGIWASPMKYPSTHTVTQRCPRSTVRPVGLTPPLGQAAWISGQEITSGNRAKDIETTPPPWVATKCPNNQDTQASLKTQDHVCPANQTFMHDCAHLVIMLELSAKTVTQQLSQEVLGRAHAHIWLIRESESNWGRAARPAGASSCAMAQCRVPGRALDV